MSSFTRNSQSQFRPARAVYCITPSREARHAAMLEFLRERGGRFLLDDVLEDLKQAGFTRCRAEQTCEELIDSGKIVTRRCGGVLIESPAARKLRDRMIAGEKF